MIPTYCEWVIAVRGTVREIEGVVFPLSPFILRELERCRLDEGVLNSTTSVEGVAAETEVRFSQDFRISGFPLIVLLVTSILSSS